MISTSPEPAAQRSLEISLAWIYLHDDDDAELVAALLSTTAKHLRNRLALGGKAGQIAARQVIACHYGVQVLTGMAILLAPTDPR